MLGEETLAGQVIDELARSSGPAALAEEASGHAGRARKAGDGQLGPGSGFAEVRVGHECRFA